MKKGKVLTLILVSLLLIALVGSFALNFKPEDKKKKTYVKHTVIAELPITLEDCSASTFKGGTDYSHYLSIATDLNVEDKNTASDFIKISWVSGMYFRLNVNFDDYDFNEITHLSFWLYSDSTTFETGKPLLVKDTTSTVFNAKKRMISADKTFEDILASEPNAVEDNFFVFGTWNRVEVPIEDVLSFSGDGELPLFHTYSSGLTTTSIYIGGFALEKIETIVK